MAAPYRCSKCIESESRCVACAGRRAAAVRAQRAAKREAGICTECARKAKPGHSRCRRHIADNNARSAAAHAAAAAAED